MRMATNLPARFARVIRITGKESLTFPDERDVGLLSTGFSSANDLQGFFMILLSRAVTPSLLAGLLGIFFFVSSRPCAAVGSSFSVPEAFSAEADLHVLLLPRAIQLDHVYREQCSNLEILHQWFRFTAPETYQAAESVKRLLVEQATLAMVQLQQSQEMQRDWFVEQLNLVAETSRGNLEQLAAIRLPIQPATDAAKGDLPGDAELPDFFLDQESGESAYWRYYRDCERWGVELTRGVQQLPPRNVAKHDVVAVAGPESEKIAPSAEDRNKNLKTIFAALNRTAEWFGQALRSIEFAATESRIASREGSKNRSN